MKSPIAEKLDEIRRLAADAVKYKQGYRYGQALFNIVHDCRPDIAKALAGTDVDPFYDDAKSEAFLTEVFNLLKESY